MLKDTVYQIAGSNIENLGSDLEFKIKQESAGHEPAWNGTKERLGLSIWRIEKFKVHVWPKEHYGSFYNGDSYIVLNAYKDHDTNEIHYDIHFWLGQNTTQDEAGTAAYKTVELDTYLDDLPIQHREVEGFESKLFLSYFPHGLFILDGGIESGFFHVIPQQYAHRLLKVKGIYRHVHCRQVPLKRESLNNGDVFILDQGEVVFQFQGANAGPFERIKATEVVNKIKDGRDGHVKETVVIDNNSPEDADDRFWASIGGNGAISEEDQEDQLEKRKTDLKLFRLTPERGNSLAFEPISEGSAIHTGHFSSDDVFLLDKGYIFYIWIGRNAPKEEKRHAMGYAQKYISDNHDNLPLPITILTEDRAAHILRKILAH